MKIKINYFDNEINFNNEFINVIEIESKNYFYRFIRDLNRIVNEGYSDDVIFINDDNSEKNMNGKLKVVVDYFGFNFDSKKYTNDILKYVNGSMNEDDKKDLYNLYNKIVKMYDKILNEVELPLSVESDISIENITKFMKVSINKNNGLLDNLLLLIDLERVLKLNNILFFVNLKQYLTKVELIELYKYAIYNQVSILLVDSQSYGTTLYYEKKLIIDNNLDEFMI